MKIPYIYILGLLLLCASCIGTDVIDEPEDPSIMLAQQDFVLSLGQTAQIDAVFHFNMYYPLPDEPIFYQSQNPTIAEVDDAGLVSARAGGQTTILAYVPNMDTARIPVTVVASDTAVARIEISAPNTSLEISEILQLAATAFTLSDAEKEVTFTWSSSNNAVATVNMDGLVTGISDGVVSIFAQAEGVMSMGFTIMVGSDARVGVFMGSGGYNAAGTAVLTFNNSGELILTLSDDFETDFALGTYVYLANSTSGGAVKNQGLEIAEVTGNGAAEFNISSVDNGIGLDTYQYVILLCKPAGITFGFAELQ